MTPFDTLSAARTRTAEAVVAQSGLAHPGLRARLREMLAGGDTQDGALLQEPLIEGSHPFVTAVAIMQQLAGSLLHPALVEAMDRLPAGHDYRFPRSRKPFQHQLEAWERLLQPGDPQSVLVTSGTGSGKTECFLLPILSDLVRQADGSGAPLEGVQAIMLYPLNALIESQRERLSAWTAPFRDKVRYCLYNGDLDRSRPASEQRQKPEQVIDREQLRRSPPPIVVTNITMLEYMLARAEDRPILDRSQGKLRWIVLDEAHSLVGAAAAEIALLLRRVLLAFGVAPDNVRFAATSATIGSGERVKEQLQRFLADVAGIPDARVHVIEGHRRLPGRPVAKGAAIDVKMASPEQLYDALGADPDVWRLVEDLFKGGLPLSRFSTSAARLGVDATDLVSLIARAARPLPDGELERLAPVRIHAFERAVAGFWSCINPECTARPESWPFGRILAERADLCPSCRAPVLEIISCVECGEPFLEGVESAGHLHPPIRTPPRDEFAFDSADEGVSTDDGDETEGEVSGETELADTGILFAARPTAAARGYWLDSAQDWRIVDGPGEGHATFLYEERDRGFVGSTYCPHCNPSASGTTRRQRPLRFGAPFILGNAAPILLEGVEPAPATETPLPARGRRLLSFTDSRQGTARMAARLQTEAERNFVRSFVYHQTQVSARPPENGEEEIQKLQTEIGQFEPIFAQTGLPALGAEIDRRRKRISELTAGSAAGIAWPDLVERLSERPEVSEWIKDIWQARDGDQFADSRRVAEFLLLRELDRRPKRANSLETLGLARLRHPAIDTLNDTQLPPAFRRRGKGIADWKAYLELLLTHFVRGNRAIEISRDLLHWIVPKMRPKGLVGPEAETGKDAVLLGWPNRVRGYADARPKAYLIRGLGLNLADAGDRDDLEECLQLAWKQIAPTLSVSGDRLAYSFRKAFVAPVISAYLCPVTRRVVDHAPFGITPYGLERGAKPQMALPIEMPSLTAPAVGVVDREVARKATESWLESDSVEKLRDIGAWSAFTDRIALFADYSRSAEHSAQQESARLRRYEQDFRAGRINLLNCSTTMEMGVDIGSVLSVMMTNVPPSIANYRQRVGRAGRRNQATALAFTFCKDRPLDRDAFRDPAAFLSRSVAAPAVSLQSRPIVQRHVNALLLGAFMRSQAGDAVKMQIGAFLGFPAGLDQARPPKDDRPVAMFLEWLQRPATRQGQQGALEILVRRSILEGDGRLIDDAHDAMAELVEVFAAEWEGLRALARDEGLKDAGKSRMGVELKRLCEEFLLSGLADRGFLPGHGFPTDVVSFMPGKEFELWDRASADGRRQFRTTGPQRSLDLAIRDYAPGSEIVLDGLVHRSAGVTLNWKRPASEENLPEIQSLRQLWQCAACGASDIAGSATPAHCLICGADSPLTQEFLRPAGFSVDPREKAHAETDFLTYVAPEDPLVSTRDAPWRNLPIPEAGRFRTSREGMVYYSNLGPQHLGYAVCLQCGRAGAESEPGSNAALPKELETHKPLRFRKDVDLCTGNDRPFSIKRHLALGHEITTDVIELQPRRSMKRPAADALAIALREALAQELGIEADELGFATARSKNHLGGDAVSLLLFDRAAGGAGFSTSLETLLQPVLGRAERILDCKTPGCVNACPACVLVSDAPEGVDKLNRSAALAFLRDHLQLPAQIAPEDSFVPGAAICVAIVDEIDKELRRVARATVTLFLPEGTDFAALDAWPITEQVHRWRERGHVLRLAIAPGSPSGPTAVADRLALRDFAIAHQAQIWEAPTVRFRNGAASLAMVYGERDGAIVWASRDLQARLPGPAWGRPERFPIVRGVATIELAAASIDMRSLLPPPGAQMLRIGNEWNGDLAGFGSRASEAVAGILQKSGAWPSCGIAEIVYEDPYVCAPLPARLAIDVIAALVKRSGVQNAAVRIETRIPRPSDRGPPGLLTHNWASGDDQQSVISALGAKRGLVTSVRHRDVPHGRFMTLVFADKSRATVILDQGFGAWAPPRGIPVRFDFNADHARQTERLGTINVVLEKQGAGRTYVIGARG